MPPAHVQVEASFSLDRGGIMHAFVTGAAGFIGSALCRRLLSEGFTVVGVDSMTDHYAIELKRDNLLFIGANPSFRFIEADLNTADIGALADGADFIFHQAGQPGVRGSWGKRFAEYTSANVLATQRLLEAACSLSGLRRFVFASSSSVYGDAERYPTLELDRPQPVSPYGVTKLAAEHLCYSYGVESGLPTVSLRYFTVYGPRQRPDMAFTRFLGAALADQELTIFGDGTQLRDFTFVEDIVDANMRAAHYGGPAGSVFNVSGGSNVSVNEVLEMIEDLVGRPLKVKRIAHAMGDVFRTRGSTKAIEKALGWRPRISISEGLTLQRDWQVASQGPIGASGELVVEGGLRPASG